MCHVQPKVNIVANLIPGQYVDNLPYKIKHPSYEHINGADDLPMAPREACENEAANLDHTDIEEPMVPAMTSPTCSKEYT